MTRPIDVSSYSCYRRTLGDIIPPRKFAGKRSGKREEIKTAKHRRILFLSLARADSSSCLPDIKIHGGRRCAADHQICNIHRRYVSLPKPCAGAHAHFYRNLRALGVAPYVPEAVNYGPRRCAFSGGLYSGAWIHARNSRPVRNHHGCRMGPLGITESISSKFNLAA